MDQADYIRAFRFGFGQPSNGNFDPFAELAHGATPAPQIADELRRRYLDLVEAQQAKAEAKKMAQENADQPSDTKGLNKDLSKKIRTYHNNDVHTAITAAVATPDMFTFRLSAFWANHFSLGPTNQILRGLAGLYEAGTLRPLMFGSFYDLLAAAELHPAMVLYLNLQQSIGPNSKAGKRMGKGFNENLGREILELHTLGVDGGYNQADIIALSKLLTGWHVEKASGDVVFTPNRAEPGVKELLGKSLGGEAPHEQDVKDALHLIATHPSTARFIARKLTTHFFGPNHPDVEAALATTFTSSKGNLTTVYKAMLSRPEAQAPLGQQTRNDYIFLVSALRAGKLVPDAFAEKPREDNKPPIHPLSDGAMDSLTQKLWAAPSPKGWPDDPTFWLSSSVMGARLKRIPMIVRRFENEEPVAFATRVLGPLLRPQTLATIKLASNRLQATGLVLASPEFNRS